MAGPRTRVIGRHAEPPSRTGRHEDQAEHPSASSATGARNLSALRLGRLGSSGARPTAAGSVPVRAGGDRRTLGVPGGAHLPPAAVPPGGSGRAGRSAPGASGGCRGGARCSRRRRRGAVRRALPVPRRSLVRARAAAGHARLRHVLACVLGRVIPACVSGRRRSRLVHRRGLLSGRAGLTAAASGGGQADRCHEQRAAQCKRVAAHSRRLVSSMR
jgi:hypothetical protein